MRKLQYFAAVRCADLLLFPQMLPKIHFLVWCLTGVAFVSLGMCLHAENRLVILNWDDYLDEGLLQQFEHEYGADVIQILYSSEEDRTARLASSNGQGYDLIMSSGIDLGSYARRGWIAAIDEGKLPELANVDPGLRIWSPA